MFELAVAILILISIFVFLKMRKKKLSATTGEQEKPVNPSSEQVVLQTKEVSKDVNEAVLTETTVEKTVASPEPEVKPVTTPVQTTSTTLTPSAPVYKNRNIPQDSMLRRHYLAHLQTMISELNQPCPTDAALIRHHQALLATKLELYLNDEAATEKLTECYENYKKSPALSVQKPQVTASSSSETKAACTDSTEQKADCIISKIPEDSMLKRHYLSQLSAQVAGKLSPRPTDSALRRHYDAMLETEIKKHLGG